MDDNERDCFKYTSFLVFLVVIAIIGCGFKSCVMEHEERMKRVERGCK